MSPERETTCPICEAPLRKCEFDVHVSDCVLLTVDPEDRAVMVHQRIAAKTAEKLREAASGSHPSTPPPGGWGPRHG